MPDATDRSGVLWTWDNLVAVAKAASEVASNQADDIDSRLSYVYVQPARGEWQALRDALARLEGTA